LTAERIKRNGGGKFKKRRTAVPVVDPFDRLIGFYDIFICDLAVVDTDSFIESNQMGRGIKADAIAGFV